MNNNSDDSNCSGYSFNGSHMAELRRELSGQPKNRDLGLDSESNRDIDYRYFLKILMERERSPYSKERSSSRSQWSENSREHRRGQVRNRDRDVECNRERDRSFPPYNYNATDLLNSYVGSNRRDPSMIPACNNDSISPWNINPMDGMMMSQSNMTMNQSSLTMPMSCNPEMAPNFSVNSMSTPWNINPMDSVAVSQNHMMINQSSSAMSVPSNLEMAQTSSSNINPMNTPWNINPMNQSNMTVHQSYAAPVSSNLTMAHTSNSKINPKRTRWNNPVDNITTSQTNITINQSSAATVSSSETGNSSQYSMATSQANNFSLPVKEIIRLKKSVLYPPSPIAPPPTRNEKPPGCTKIYVGCLPVRTTEKILEEIFEMFGPIQNITLTTTKKKSTFGHIYFFDELSVERAINLSGYRLKIDDRDGISFSSRIHVDYAKTKNDVRDSERKQHSQNNAIINPVGPISSNLEMTETSNSSVNSCVFMTGIGNCQPQYRVITPQEINFASPVKDIIQFAKSVLIPPDPKTPNPTAREKPPGCKTVFVGGLPCTDAEEVIEEIFETCGTIANLRVSGNNFSHIQFCDELSVENAIYFSGYTLKIESKDGTVYSGRLNVHYSLVREGEHEEQHQNEAISSLRYSELEASRICKKLQSEETFSQAASILINWLEKGECKKREACAFYSMIQCTQKQVKKLEEDKVRCEETLNNAKSIFKKQMDANIQKFIEIEKIYNAASLQKCWDNFTKTQRKNIEIWKKQAEELKNVSLEEVINEREDEEMELSDDDDNNDHKKNDAGQVKRQSKEYIQKLQEEINFLKCQLEATKTEIKTAQSEEEESKNKDNQLSAIRTALQNSMKEVLELNQKYSKAEAELKELRGSKCTKSGEQNEDNDLSHDGDDAGVSSSINLDNSRNLENDIRLVSLISSFLIVQPFGATADYIWPYLHQIDSSINVRDIENLMKRFPMLFKEESSGTETNLEKKWKFIGFQAVLTLS